MPIIEARGSLSSQAYGQFARQGTSGAFIEDVFSTTLYTGTGAAQAVPNGIQLGTGATSQAWFSAFSGSFTRSLRRVAVDSAGNAHVCGSALVGATTVPAVAKLSPAGAVLWQTSLTSTTITSFVSVGVGPSGDAYTCGLTSLGFAVVKYNSSGVLQWQREYQRSGFGATVNAIFVDSSDFVYVTGQTDSGAALFLVKINSSGTLQWQVRYPGEFNVYGNAIAVDSSGNVHVVGVEGYTSGEDNYNRAIILKFNSSGTLLWKTAIGQAADGNFTGWGCSLDSSGNVYSTVHGNNSNTIILSKLNPSGARLWQSTYSTNAQQQSALVTSSSGDSYICVRTGGSINNGFVAKFDTSGTIQWQRRFQTSVFNEPLGIALSGTDSFWVVAPISNSPTFSFTARLPTDGSGTGSYIINGLTVSYVSASETVSTITRIDNTAGTPTAGVLAVSTPTFTDTPTSFFFSTTTVPQGTGLGGLVWIKGRSGSTNHALYDTSRGATLDLMSDSSAAQTTEAQGLTAFLGNGFSIGTLAKLNTSSAIYAAWTFAEQPKFFDIVTYTGNGSNRTIAHNLGSVPGCIIVKRANNFGGWQVYHRSNDPLEYLELNTTNVASESTARWNGTAPTASVFSVGTDGSVNDVGGSYVAYLFAHNAGGFGPNGTDSVISCGSYTGNGSTAGPTVTLGWEPQWLLIKRSNSGGTNWVVLDNMRGLVVGANDSSLFPNSNVSENLSTLVTPTATGFQLNSTSSDVNSSDLKYVYIAIRRGPMRTPTSGSSVFTPVVYTGNGSNSRFLNTSIPPDMMWMRQRDDSVLAGMVVGDRLRGQPYLLTGSTAAEVTSSTAFDQQNVGGLEYGTAFSAMGGVYIGADATAKLNTISSASNQVAEAFRRAPGFFDVVCYTGGASTLTLNHNLGVVPELIITKYRSGGSATTPSWFVGSSYLTNGFSFPTGHVLILNTTAASTEQGYFSSATSSSILLQNVVARSGENYVAYLFASCPGVSKIGTYTGTGSTVQVNCGFTAGARFVLIKRTNATGDWYLWDAARGIVAGDDPYLLLNSTSPQVNGTDWVDTLATGFEVSNAGSNLVNVNGGVYLFLAIA